jgi:sulfite reductase beta subunit-like hemoprotein
VAAIGRIYLEIAPKILGDGARRKSRKPRWREIVDYVGFDEVCASITQNRPRMNCGLEGQVALRRLNVDRKLANISSDRLTHGGRFDPIARNSIRGRCEAVADIGIHTQNDDRHYYIGIVIPFGKLQSSQLIDLTQLSETYGNDELRLTPWQNIIIPNVQQPIELQAQLTQLGYSTNPIHPAAALVACSGSPGCASSFTATQTDAMRIIENLQIDRPINIHVSGCSKGCAQPYASDIALMGMASGNYDLYVRSGNEIFGELVRSDVAPIELPQVIQAVMQC